MAKDEFGNFYEAVYGQDNPGGDGTGWIQWKGTEACIDLHCTCGHHGHIDGMFFYYYRCPKCKKVFAVGQNIKLIPLNQQQVTYVEKTRGSTIMTDETPEEE